MSAPSHMLFKLSGGQYHASTGEAQPHPIWDASVYFALCGTWVNVKAEAHLDFGWDGKTIVSNMCGECVKALQALQALKLMPLAQAEKIWAEAGGGGLYVNERLGGVVLDGTFEWGWKP